MSEPTGFFQENETGKVLLTKTQVQLISACRKVLQEVASEILPDEAIANDEFVLYVAEKVTLDELRNMTKYDLTTLAYGFYRQHCADVVTPQTTELKAVQASSIAEKCKQLQDKCIEEVQTMCFNTDETPMSEELQKSVSKLILKKRKQLQEEWEAKIRKACFDSIGSELPEDVGTVLAMQLATTTWKYTFLDKVLKIRHMLGFEIPLNVAKEIISIYDIEHMDDTFENREELYKAVFKIVWKF